MILFGLPETKDDKASGAYARDGIVQRAVRALKKELPDLIVITDVCLCEYMSHGHCGIVHEGRKTVLNDPTLELLAKTALSHAEAGADLVAPPRTLWPPAPSSKLRWKSAGHSRTTRPGGLH